MLKGEIVILNSPPGAPFPCFGGRNVIAPASKAEASYFCRYAAQNKCSDFQPASVTRVCNVYIQWWCFCLYPREPYFKILLGERSPWLMVCTPLWHFLHYAKRKQVTILLTYCLLLTTLFAFTHHKRCYYTGFNLYYCAENTYCRQHCRRS